MVQQHSFEELYDLTFSLSEGGQGLTREERERLLEEADSRQQQEISLSLIARCIAEAAERVGCGVTVTTADSSQTVKEHNVKAFTAFVVTFFCAARSAALMRHAEVCLRVESSYCMAQMTFDADEHNSKVSAAVDAFIDYAARKKMRFDCRRENGSLTVTFIPVSKDWALLEVKSPVDDGDELIVVN